ncbi:hypothetical protein PVIIG_05355 [Plasmodium vivax India VII]|uniref:Uncharacterized protein n=1 Tax=Plasmodium vivax India VII TaxID=1077284 RepID=A0A0J9SHK9_PLAVI|nr:hypothetical protein PVIIG_05355 [Plasmodium vivax India VII]
MVIKSLGLPSDNFYEKLDHDEDTNLSNYNSECISFSSNKINLGLKRPCALVLKYLANSYKKSEKANMEYDDCILLNYWIYGKIYEKHRDISNSGRSFGELQRLWNSLILNPYKTSYNDKCEPDNSIATQNDWKKRKELYGYCVDYDTLQRMISNYDKHCKIIYKYLKEKVELYNEYYEYCSSGDNNNKCPRFFSKCENKDPNNLLSQLTCKEVMQAEEALSAKEDKRLATAAADLSLTADNAGLPMGSQMPDAGSNPVTKSGNVLLGVVVTSMTSGALYKVKTDLIITY